MTSTFSTIRNLNHLVPKEDIMAGLESILRAREARTLEWGIRGIERTANPDEPSCLAGIFTSPGPGCG
jgi:hypothetical protein